MSKAKTGFLPSMDGKPATLPARPGTGASVCDVGGDLPMFVELGNGMRTQMSVADALSLAGRIVATAEAHMRYGNG
jgi:hypothetical protein